MSDLIRSINVMHESMEAAIFDLDGVIVDTAKYHYLAWKRLADQLGIDFTKDDNERLKGVSRMDSLNILLSLGNQTISEVEKRVMANMKNEWYLTYIGNIDESEILPGAEAYLKCLQAKNIKSALGSASKNARTILANVGLLDYFEMIVDGTVISAAKPDPQVFTKGADCLGVPYDKCVVYEDSEAGVKGAKMAGMGCVGIGSEKQLSKADLVVKGLHELIMD